MQDSSTACNSAPLHRRAAYLQRACTFILSTLAIVLLCPTHAFAGDRYSEVAARIQALDGGRSGHAFQLGKSGKGRPIYAVHLSDSGSTRPAQTRILVISGQHGDEVSPVFAMLDLADDMARARDPRLAALLRNTEIVIVPVVNPDGFASHRRYNAQGTDLNRNWRSSGESETRSVATLVSRFKPQVVIDLHEWMDRNPLHTNCVEVAGFGSAPQRKLARLLSAFSRHDMAKHSSAPSSIRTVFYRNESDPRLAHRHFSNQGICGMLVETASGQPRDARKRIYREFVTSAVRTLAESGDSRIVAQLAAVSRSLGEARPAFARAYEPKPAPTAGAGDIACWVVMVAATAYIVIRSLGSRAKRTNDVPVFGRLSSMHPEIYRVPLTDVVRANIPLRARVALIQQQRVRPSDRGKQVGVGRAA